MKLRIVLDTGDSPVIERDAPFATRCMEITREGFSTEKSGSLVYIPGRRVRHIELLKEDK